MKKVTYRGTAGRARIREQDWKAVNVSSKEVVWNGYGDEQEVANDAADHLAEKDDRFEVEGAGDDSAYARRLSRSSSEQTNRARVGTRGNVGPSATTTGTAPSGTASADDSTA